MLQDQIQRARLGWGRLSSNQRLAIIAVLVTAAIAGTLLMVMRPPQRYETAFSGLASDDAAAIVDDLRSQGIPYELSGDGSTIRVPADKVADVRLSAASKGLPKGGGTGFELFDKTSFGITDFAQRVNYQRAIEGELQRTIDHIDAVAQSRVHVVIPEESLFTDQQQPTTAAVVLDLKPGRELTDAQIKGIAHLVSSAVPGLKPENLTVVDSAGNPIWSGDQGTAQSGVGNDDRFRLEQAYEANVERELQSLVSRVVGNDHVAVRVNAQMNWDQRTVDNEIYSPDNTQPQIRSQQEKTQSTNGGGTGATGVPGVDSNVQSFQEGTPQAGQSSSSSREVTTNYELSKRVEHVVQAPGQLQRLSVAVLLDGKQVDPAVAQEIQNVVTTAAGIVPQRGDTVTVSAVPFTTAPAAAQGNDSRQELIQQGLSVLKVVGLILIPIIAILFARRSLLRQRELRPALPPPYATYPRPAATPRVTVTEAPPPPVEPPTPQPSLAYQQVAELANADPNQIAQLIRLWMNEEQ